jgi:hypothetical protein
MELQLRPRNAARGGRAPDDRDVVRQAAGGILIHDHFVAILLQQLVDAVSARAADETAIDQDHRRVGCPLRCGESRKVSSVRDATELDSFMILDIQLV